MRRVARLLTTTALIWSASAAAMAQQAVEQDQPDSEARAPDIVITGSRVRRTDLESNSPITVVGGERLNLSAETNIVEQLQELPGFTATRSPSSGGDSGFTGSFLDLRGLGRGRTLTLVNGRRWINTISDGGVDVSTIPPELIERVEIVTGGASATYGSDAVAGVVNLIFKDDFDGFELNGQTGVTGRGEATNSRISITGGDKFGNGRGRFYVHGSYDRTNAIDAGDRSFLNPAYINQGGRLVRLDSDVIGAGSALVGGTRAKFNSGGNLFSAPGIVNALTASDLFNAGSYARVQIPAEKFTFTAGAKYDLTEKIRVYGDAIYIREKVSPRRAPTNRDLSGESISIANPFIGATTRAYLATLDDDADGFVQIPGLSRQFTELGPRIENNERDSYRVAMGIEIDLGNDWRIDTSAIYSESNFTIRTDGQIHNQRLSQALDAVQGPGGITCRQAMFGGVPCVPVNIFGPNAITPAAAEFLLVEGGLRGGNADTNVQSILTGNLIQLPAGPVGIALGVEYRKSRAFESPNEVWKLGLSEDQLAAFSAALEQKEVFGEAVIPILKDIPFLYRLGLEVGFRYTKFDPGADAWTYKLLGEWSPIKEIRFRGGIQRATRAPNPYELGAGDQSPVPIAAFGGDPCFTGAPLTGDLRTSCIANGVPVAIANAGGTVSPSYELRATAFGNPNLTPETAKTFTVGTVIENLGIEGLSFTADYFNTRISDVIGPVGSEIVFDRCYFSGTGGTDPFCSEITRDPTTGQIRSFDLGPQNAGGYKVRGVDLSANFSRRMAGLSGNARLGVSFNATRLIDFILTPVVAQPDIRFNCAGYYGPTCQIPRPKWQTSTVVSWQEDRFNVALTWNWIGGIKDDALAYDPAVVPDLARTRIGNRHYFDLGGGFRVNDAFEFRLGIENLLDSKPPVIGIDRAAGAADNNTIPGLFDALGRRFFFGVRLKT